VATNTADQNPNPPGLRGLLAQLIEQLTELGRLYATAARQEVEEGLNHIKVAAVFFGVVGILLAVAAVVLVILVVEAISVATGIPRWATAMFVLLVVFVLAVLFGFLGYRRIQKARIIPEETIAAAKEDLEWAQHLTRRG
jgi:TRAP-type C4-dicarboxylate transport system permease small subunit